MQLNKHPAGITDHQSWFRERPPKKGMQQWQEGRSAKELAKYMTDRIPFVPAEIEAAAAALVSPDTCFDWDAEYVTALPGKGEGRNHDAVLFADDLVITIEAKADEPLSNRIGEELQHASVNKLHRISTMLNCLFPGGFRNYEQLRYQLLTASVGTLLEARKRNASKALLLVLVFRTNGRVEAGKLEENAGDIRAFLQATKAYEEKGLMVIPNNTGIKLYFREIVI